MFVTESAFYALLVTAILAGLNLVRTRHQRADFIGLAAAAVCTFLLTWGLNWLILYFARPAMVGPLRGYIWLSFPFLVGWVIFLINDLILSADSFDEYHRREDASSFGTGTILIPILLAAFAVFWLKVTVFVPFGGGEAKYLANLVQVEEMTAEEYPDTDANHIVVVPEETARFRCGQKIAGGQDEAGRNLGSVYKPGRPILQSINQHLYWICDLEFAGWRVWMQVKQLSPGFIAVDAEDPDAQSDLHLGFKMKYVPSAYFANDLPRHLYNNGYNHFNVEDITLEVDDDWRPWYTASLNKPELHTSGNVPVSVIVVNPETGEVSKYPLDQSPGWIDRVYSKGTVKKMVNWWGMWAQAPWKLAFQTKANRFKVAGEPVLVYTKERHPAWQILITSLNKDTSATGVILFDGRSNHARFYPILAGTPIEEDVLRTFQETAKNIKSLPPKHLSMHKIFGVLTWVVSYISKEEGGHSGPFQGVGLLSATEVTGANVVFAPSKEAALSQYKQFLAGQSNTAAPAESGLRKDIKGTIKEIAVQIEDGDTVYLIRIVEDPDHVFRAGRTISVEIPFAQPGDKVTMQYFDSNEVQVDVGLFNDLAIPLIQ